MKYKYHVVYNAGTSIGTIEIDSGCKIDNYDAIKNIEKLIKDKNNFDNVILVNWIKLRSTADIRLRYRFAQIIQRITSYIRKRCTEIK